MHSGNMQFKQKPREEQAENGDTGVSDRAGFMFGISGAEYAKARDTNQYMYIAEQSIAINFGDINIGFRISAISILKYCWQYIANILIEQYIAKSMICIPWKSSLLPSCESRK